MPAGGSEEDVSGETPLCIAVISAPPALCTGSGSPGSAVPAREERVCKLDFLPHLDSRDELCLPSRRVVSITLAQLWLELAACHYFANQKADVTFIFLNERKKTFKYKWHQITSNRGSSILVQWEEVVGIGILFYVPDTGGEKKTPPPPNKPITKSPD